MGVSSSVDPGRPGAARQSIRASFTRRVAVPAGCLALLWLVALAAALRLALAGRSLAGSHASWSPMACWPWRDSRPSPPVPR